MISVEVSDFRSLSTMKGKNLGEWREKLPFFESVKASTGSWLRVLLRKLSVTPPVFSLMRELGSAAFRPWVPAG